VLDEERVRRRLQQSTRSWTIELLAVTDSTNRLVAERATEGAPEGLVVAADLQTAGRGRLDRTWETGPGDALLVSVLTRPTDLPPSRWHLVTAATGLSAVAACEEAGGFTPDLKWPNDLMVGSAKLAGILAEASAGAVVVGMGLNVHAAPDGAAWADQAAGRRVDRSELLGAWLAAFDGWLGRWDDVARAYRETCATVGQRVTVTQPNATVEGRAESIDDDGRLVLVLGDGQKLALSVGDVNHLRPAGP
jgi:BirA family biotin operon repressor/biotin-[acetyl-CoA-carboxylase] ligase